MGALTQHARGYTPFMPEQAVASSVFAWGLGGISNSLRPEAQSVFVVRQNVRSVKNRFAACAAITAENVPDGNTSRIVRRPD